jgi:hypothetical protein
MKTEVDNSPSKKPQVRQRGFNKEREFAMDNGMIWVEDAYLSNQSIDHPEEGPA